MPNLTAPPESSQNLQIIFNNYKKYLKTAKFKVKNLIKNVSEEVVYGLIRTIDD